MSRIGKKPVEIPSGVEVKVESDNIYIKGPKGSLSLRYPEGISISVDDGKIIVARRGDSKNEKALHGLSRSLISNMIRGVSQGYQRVLEIHGVGYRAQLQGNRLLLSLGYSHPVEYHLPEGVSATVDQKQTTITLTSIDKHLLGQVAANLRTLRSPDPYKGKGIRYAGESLKLKVGKAGKK